MFKPQKAASRKINVNVVLLENTYKVKLGDKERFDKEKIGVKEPFPVTNCQFTSLG